MECTENNIKKHRKNCKENFDEHVRFEKTITPFKIGNKSNVVKHGLIDNTNNYCCSICKRSYNRERFCENCRNQKNELTNTSLSKREHSLSPVIENSSGKWVVIDISERSLKRQASSDELFNSHIKKHSRHINSSDVSMSTEKLLQCKNKKADVQCRSSEYHSANIKNKTHVSTKYEKEKHLQPKQLFSKHEDFKYAPKMVNTSNNDIDMKQISSSSRTNEINEFSCKSNESSYKSNESLANTSNTNSELLSSSVSCSTPYQYLNTNSPRFMNYRENNSIFSPSPASTVKFNLSNSFDSSFNTPKRSSKFFPRYRLAPVYKTYQLLGDSQFVRFSQQILHYRHVDFTPDTRSRFIGLCVSGQTIEALLNRIKKKEYSVSKKVILMIGTNNFKQNTKLGFMVDNMKLLIDEIKLYAEKLVILTVPPVPLLEHQEKHWMLLETFNNFLMNFNNEIDVFVIDIVKYCTSKPHVCNMELFERFFGNSNRPDLIHLNYNGLKQLERCLNTNYFHK